MNWKGQTELIRLAQIAAVIAMVVIIIIVLCVNGVTGCSRPNNEVQNEQATNVSSSEQDSDMLVPVQDDGSVTVMIDRSSGVEYLVSQDGISRRDSLDGSPYVDSDAINEHCMTPERLLSRGKDTD